MRVGKGDVKRLKFGALFLMLGLVGCNQAEINELKQENTGLKTKNDSLRQTLEIRDQNPLLRFQKALEMIEHHGRTLVLKDVNCIINCEHNEYFNGKNSQGSRKDLTYQRSNDKIAFM